MNKVQLAKAIAEFEAAKAEAAATVEAAKLEAAAIIEAAKAVKPVMTTGAKGGRIAPLQDKVVSLLQTGAASVTAMALTFEVAERDIRLAIDRARLKGWAIKRTDKGVFGF